MEGCAFRKYSKSVLLDVILLQCCLWFLCFVYMQVFGRSQSLSGADALLSKPIDKQHTDTVVNFLIRIACQVVCLFRYANTSAALVVKTIKPAFHKDPFMLGLFLCLCISFC